MLAKVDKIGKAVVIDNPEGLAIHIDGSSLTVQPDLANFYPLYVAETDNSFYISTQQLLLRNILNTTIDLAALEKYLHLGGAPMSLFEGIDYIQPGHGVTITSNGYKVFSLNIPESSMRLFDGVPLFREALISVIDKLPNEVTSDCSGGLDSTPLTLLAASQKKNVTAFTLSYSQETEDLRIAKNVCDTRAIQQIIVNDHPVHYTDEEVPLTDEPIDFWFSSAETMHYLDLIGENHISGEGGDAVLGCSLSYLFNAPFSIAWRHLFQWSKQKRRSPISLFYSLKKRHYFRGDWIEAKRSTMQEKGSWYNLWDTAKTCRILQQMAQAKGKKIHFPFLHDEIVRVCFSIFEHERMDPFCLKPLMKQAFPEFPDIILNRNTKGDFTPDVYIGYQKNHKYLRDRFDQMLLADLGIINLKRFHDAMDRMNMGLYVPLWEFDITIATEMWLQKLRSEQKC